MPTFRRLVLAAAMMTLGATATHAVCTPFGGDDAGCLTADATKAKCENKAAKNVAKMYKGFLKCHSKTAAALLAGKPFDEESCEGDVVAKWVLGTLTVPDCPCVDKTTLATHIEAVADGDNSLLYCDGAGTPFGGDDTGTAPSTKPVLTCESKLVKCWAKLVKDHLKCHITAETAFVKGDTFDEEACEEGPLDGKSAAERYNSCVAKVLAKGGCNGCENPAQVLINVNADLDGTTNGLVYCEM